MTRSKRAARAAELKAQGLNGIQIAEAMGLSRTYAYALLTDPTGEKDRDRKASYGGTCIDCGGPTDGSNGAKAAPKVCRSCIEWTREEALDAVSAFFEDNGRSPRVVDFLGLDRFAVSTFGGWNEMLLAAGLPLNQDRRDETQADIERMLAAGSSVSEVAEAFGWTTHNIHMRLRTRGLSLEDFGQRGVASWREEREHIVRRWNEGASAGDIARELGMPPANISSRISRMRRDGYDLPHRSPAHWTIQSAA